jgi:hypothetical protein
MICSLEINKVGTGNLLRRSMACLGEVRNAYINLIIRLSGFTNWQRRDSLRSALRFERRLEAKMLKKIEQHLQRDFKINYVTYWNHLSLGFLFIVHIGLILPLGVLDRLWFYCLGLLLEFISIYFFVVSIWYWVVTNIS